MRMLLFIILMFFLRIDLYSQEKVRECNSSIFLDIDYSGEIPVYDHPNGNITNIVKNDFNKENYVLFDILLSNDSLFYVSAYYSIGDIIIPIKGWIKKNIHLGIFSRAYNEPLIFYACPSKYSKSVYIEKEYNPNMYVVLDCIDRWLKVRIVIEKETYEGWIPPEMQCCNVYSTCN